jgi:hypothetical protein
MPNDRENSGIRHDGTMFHLMFIELHFFIVLVMAYIYQNNTYNLSKCMIRIFTVIVYEQHESATRKLDITRLLMIFKILNAKMSNDI